MAKYKVLLNKLTVGESNDDMEGFKRNKKFIDEHFGAFIDNGLPYTYGSNA